ncbi:hypothetical protein Psta_4367 [Pirellula staleyi DSM 6068]|uniref:DNA-binding protein n=1 Tax=Pirellula staleyi (strain ATCC 27377 / DSM 6068 / ICPB 4128) TaxID=530564 RepID=D2R552_PIRSD|nr:hypothetical protein [Pirellula staleyi]ADB19014.1 hypothetical protein Psta_4367 [Pirellula staleyi DSM 6068]
MTPKTVELNEAQLAQIIDRARSQPEPALEIARAIIEQDEQHREQEFQNATTYLLEKNRELYRRLSQ